MRDLKSLIFVLMLLALAIAPGVGAQETAIEPTPAAEELSPEQFWEEISTAFQANNAVRIQQLITANPTTAEQMQQRLTELGKGMGEEAEQYRTLAEIFGKFRSGDFSFIFDRLNEEAKQAYYISNRTYAKV
jgi:hypothetical protein